MPRPLVYRTPHAVRLGRILDELGYVQNGQVNYARAARVIERQTMQPFSVVQLRALLYRDAKWTAERAVQVADGLGVDVRELLYDDVPKPGRRPARLLDQIEWLTS